MIQLGLVQLPRLPVVPALWYVHRLARQLLIVTQPATPCSSAEPTLILLMRSTIASTKRS